MFGKNRKKTVGLCVMVVTSCFILATIWAVLATPETALAKKPGGGGGKPEALHGTATFRDALGDRVQSDGGGPYTDASIGKKGSATVLGLGEFFRLKVQEDKKGVGRRFDLSFPDSVPASYLPSEAYFWSFNVSCTLSEFRAVTIGNSAKMNARLYFGTKGRIASSINYGNYDYLEEAGDPVTVTRTGEYKWTIESLPGDEAFLRKENEDWRGRASMPFLIEYDGTP